MRITGGMGFSGLHTARGVVDASGTTTPTVRDASCGSVSVNTLQALKAIEERTCCVCRAGPWRLPGGNAHASG